MGQQSLTKITIDGKEFYVAPGGDPVPVEDINGPAQEPGWTGTAHRLVDRVKGALPEIAAGGSMLLAPETGGLSLAIPPLVAAATEAGKEYYDTGTIDPLKVGSRGLVNALPGVAGKAVAKFGGGALMRALAAGGSGSNAMGSLMKGLASFGEEAPLASQSAGQTLARTGQAGLTRATQIAKLQAKLPTLGMNPQAKAAVELAIKRLQDTEEGAVSTGIAAKLRALLAGGSLASGSQ